jgi:chemotaxis protein CheX
MLLWLSLIFEMCINLNYKEFERGLSMDVMYINPFIEASNNVLSQFGISLTPGKIHLKTTPALSGKVCVIIGVTGNLKGQVFFNLEVDVALKIASYMMGGVEVKEFDELSKSAISELINMVLGNSATLFYNKGLNIDITPPSLIIGEKMTVSSSKGQVICVPLVLSIGGTLDLDLAIVQE